jgi:hypothetical protein
MAFSVSSSFNSAIRARLIDRGGPPRHAELFRISGKRRIRNTVRWAEVKGRFLFVEAAV